MTLVVTYFPTYLSIYIYDLLVTEWVIKVKPDINSVKVHPKLSHNGHPVDGTLVGCANPPPFLLHTMDLEQKAKKEFVFR